jgi:hypothetical protein
VTSERCRWSFAPSGSRAVIVELTDTTSGLDAFDADWS